MWIISLVHIVSYILNSEINVGEAFLLPENKNVNSSCPSCLGCVYHLGRCISCTPCLKFWSHFQLLYTEWLYEVLNCLLLYHVDEFFVSELLKNGWVKHQHSPVLDVNIYAQVVVTAYNVTLGCLWTMLQNKLLRLIDEIELTQNYREHISNFCLVNLRRLLWCNR